MKGEAGHLVATLPTEHETPNLDCIHCGLCLPVCPTYLQLGSEVDSPRGRIYLMKAVDEGRISPSSVTFEKHMFLCLECRACETACPSGVKFSLMMNEARSAIRETRKPAAWEGLLRNFIFKTMLPSRRLLHVNFRLLRFYQRNGFQGGLQWYRRGTEGIDTAELQLFSGRTIDVPSIFIAGKQDWGTYQRPGNFERMQDTLCTRMLGCHLIDGAGHWVQQEQPARVSALLTEFLQRQ